LADLLLVEVLLERLWVTLETQNIQYKGPQLDLSLAQELAQLFKELPTYLLQEHR